MDRKEKGETDERKRREEEERSRHGDKGCSNHMVD